MEAGDLLDSVKQALRKPRVPVWGLAACGNVFQTLFSDGTDGFL